MDDVSVKVKLRKLGGYFRRLLHWGPLLALSVIAAISICSIMCLTQWWPISTVGGIINMSIYLIWNVTTLYNFFSATFIGPGYVPFKWRPKKQDDCEKLQYCQFCDGYKAPRSHHCRKCGRCVKKMDHHCPWINNCVGHLNHSYFTYFLFFAPCGCVHSLCILIPAMYRAVNRHYYLYYGNGTEPLVNLGIHGFVACMFAVGLAIGVFIAVGALFVIQIRSILKNETGIEGWIREKAHWREREEEEGDFIFPYDLGRKRNFLMVFGYASSRELDGYWWPVVDECDQFTLTVEQIKQKREKKERSVVYDIKEKYSGSILPVTKGICVFCCIPWTDEPRIPVCAGDRILVTRWRKHWLYGDKLLAVQDSEVRVRGWFPRRCAIQKLEDGAVCKKTAENGTLTPEKNKKDK